MTLYEPTRRLAVSRTLADGRKVAVGTLAQNRDGVYFAYGRCPKMYAASNKSVVDIEVIEHLLGKTAGFTHRTAYPLA